MDILDIVALRMHGQEFADLTEREKANLVYVIQKVVEYYYDRAGEKELV